MSYVPEGAEPMAVRMSSYLGFLKLVFTGESSLTFFAVKTLVPVRRRNVELVAVAMSPSFASVTVPLRETLIAILPV
jgi:hypothetical protein